MPQILIALVAVIVLGGGYFFYSSTSNDAHAEAVSPIAVTETNTLPTPTQTPSSATPGSIPTPTTPIAVKKKYFDGEYSAEGTYIIPNKEVEKMVVSLTLKDGIVTAVNFTSNPLENGSKYNQQKFTEGYKELVVGKDIDTIALTVVNGSSLTPIGFMEALKQIKEKAQIAA